MHAYSLFGGCFCSIGARARGRSEDILILIRSAFFDEARIFPCFSMELEKRKKSSSKQLRGMEVQDSRMKFFQISEMTDLVNRRDTIWKG